MPMLISQLPRRGGLGPAVPEISQSFGPPSGCRNASGKLHERHGEVPERSNGTVSKTVVRVTVPWVRIPPSPPIFGALNRTDNAVSWSRAVDKPGGPSPKSARSWKRAASLSCPACRQGSSMKSRNAARMPNAVIAPNCVVALHTRQPALRSGVRLFFFCGFVRRAQWP
jgi:hypothetical protein